MMRGIKRFVCDDCGRKFDGMDFELACTTFSAPLKCPKCGSMHTRPTCLFGLNRLLYVKIWEEMDYRIENAQDL